MQRKNITAVSNPASGTPAIARPMPPSADCTTAVTTTPSATLRIAWPASRTAFSPRSPARRRPKRPTSSAAASPRAYISAARTSVSRNCTNRKPTLPASATNHLVALPAYGISFASSPSMPAAAACSQAMTTFAPTNGRSAIHCGGVGMRKPATVCSARDDLVRVQHDRGDGQRQRHDEHQQQDHRHGRDRQARRLHSRAWNQSMTGQVATTIIAAQTRPQGTAAGSRTTRRSAPPGRSRPAACGPVRVEVLPWCPRSRVNDARCDAVVRCRTDTSTRREPQCTNSLEITMTIAPRSPPPLPPRPDRHVRLRGHARTADRGAYIDDTAITTAVKARFVDNKDVAAIEHQCRDAQRHRHAVGLRQERDGEDDRREPGAESRRREVGQERDRCATMNIRSGDRARDPQITT